MDIQYLLLLQNLRNSTSNALTPFMEMISLFAVTYLVIVPALVYWCVDKRSGLYTMASYTTTVAINAVVKLTACIYRPWIRDSRVLPAGDAITTATGYSFPSGHTTSSTSIYGALAVSAWKKMRWVSVLCIIFALLTCFSRNYLGVHTPQDVLVGMAEGVLILWAMSKLFPWLDKNPGKENIVLAMLAAGCADWREVSAGTSRPGDILKQIKPRLTPHFFRHNYVTMLYESGVDPLIAMKIVGHTDYQTTANIYTHVRDEMLKKATVNMNEVFQNRTED